MVQTVLFRHLLYRVMQVVQNRMVRITEYHLQIVVLQPSVEIILQLHNPLQAHELRSHVQLLRQLILLNGFIPILFRKTNIIQQTGLKNL